MKSLEGLESLDEFHNVDGYQSILLLVLNENKDESFNSRTYQYKKRWKYNLKHISAVAFTKRILHLDVIVDN